MGKFGTCTASKIGCSVVICSDTWGLVQVIKAGESRKHRSRGTCVPPVIALSMLCKVGYACWAAVLWTHGMGKCPLYFCSNIRLTIGLFL